MILNPKNELDLKIGQEFIDYENFRHLDARLLPSRRETFTNFFTSIAEELFPQLAFHRNARNKQLKMLALLNVLVNLYLAFNAGQVLAYSRGGSHYSMIPEQYGYHWYTYNNYMTIIDTMATLGLVSSKVGYYDKERNEGKRSRLWSLEPLIQIFQSMDELILEKASVSEFPNKENSQLLMKYFSPVEKTLPVNFTILRDSKKKMIDFPLTGKVNGIVSKIIAYNELMAEIELLIPLAVTPPEEGSAAPINRAELIASEDISEGIMRGEDCEGYNSWVSSNWAGTSITSSLKTNQTPKLLIYKDLDARLYRVFNNGRFNHGGRYYGGDYQILNSSERKQLLINGEHVVEIDYSSLHIRMLYNLLNKDITHDPYEIFPDDENLRSAVKLLINIAINAKSEREALFSFNIKLNAHYSDPTKQAKMLTIKQSILEHDLTSRKLFNKIFECHPEIRQFICSSKGIELQYIDSKIATDVLSHFTTQGTGCLCMHDSFIVPQSKSTELEAVMHEAYRIHVNGYSPKVKVEGSLG